MNLKKKPCLCLSLVLTFLLILPQVSLSQQVDKEDSELLKWLKSQPSGEVETIRAPRDSLLDIKEAYRIMLEQPLDHKNPNGKKFKQQIYLSHIDKSNPVVLVTRGYAIGRNRPVELSRLLEANQIVVEHRFLRFFLKKPALVSSVPLKNCCFSVSEVSQVTVLHTVK